MWDRPQFLDLPQRDGKPRSRGLTHMLDKGIEVSRAESLLANVGEFVDLVKIGWGIAYVDATVKERVRLYQSVGALVSTGGTLFEIAVAQGRLDAFRRWAGELGFDAVEVSNGLSALSSQRKSALVEELSRDFVVLAEVGSKDQSARVTVSGWADEMAADLAAGARWLIAEGRESGTVGLYEPDGAVRVDFVEALVERVPPERMIFEAPRRAQQVWFVRRFGSHVNLGNIGPAEVLPLETLRLGLRADTADLHLR